MSTTYFFAGIGLRDIVGKLPSGVKNLLAPAAERICLDLVGAQKAVTTWLGNTLQILLIREHLLRKAGLSRVTRICDSF
jgi:hypothetical protein